MTETDEKKKNDEEQLDIEADEADSKPEIETDNEVFAPSNNDELSDDDLNNFFSDMLEMMRLDDPDYTVYSRHHIHINHAIDLGDLLIATILALILIHMFMRDFMKKS